MKNEYKKFGECCLKDLPVDSKLGTYFRIIKKDGSLSKETFIKKKGDYCRSDNKYYCSKSSDINDWKELKGSSKVSTKFTY